MAKRSADIQLVKDGPSDEDKGSWGATSTPQKATAAQMAQRRLAKPRGGLQARRLPPVNPPQQHPAPAFGQANGTQSQPGSFTFGQQQKNGDQASASFPQFGNNNDNNNNNNNTSNISGFTPPSSDFNFQPSSTPFVSEAGQNKNNMAFNGDIFKLPAASTPVVPKPQVEIRNKKRPFDDVTSRYGDAPASSPISVTRPSNANGLIQFNFASPAQSQAPASGQGGLFDRITAPTPLQAPASGQHGLFGRVTAPDNASPTSVESKLSSPKSIFDGVKPEPFKGFGASNPSPSPSPFSASQSQTGGFNFSGQSTSQALQFPNFGQTQTGGFSSSGSMTTQATSAPQFGQTQTGGFSSSGPMTTQATSAFQFGQKQTNGDSFHGPTTTQSITNQFQPNSLAQSSAPNFGGNHSMDTSSPPKPKETPQYSHLRSFDNCADPSDPASPPKEAPRASSPVKQARPIAEPGSQKSHVEDKPAVHNVFGGLKSLSSNASANDTWASNTPTSDTLAGNPSTMNSLTSTTNVSTSKPPVRGSYNQTNASKTTNSKGLGASSGPSSMKRKNNDQEDLRSPLTAKKLKYPYNIEDGRIFGKRIPDHFTYEEKKELVTGFRLKRLDAGMAMHVQQTRNENREIRALVHQFYNDQKQDILDADGGEMAPVAERVAKRRAANAKATSDTGQSFPSMQQANIKTGLTDAPAMPLSSASKGKHKEHDTPGRDQDQASYGSGQSSHGDRKQNPDAKPDGGQVRRLKVVDTSTHGRSTSTSLTKRKATDDVSDRDEDEVPNGNGKRVKEDIGRSSLHESTSVSLHKRKAGGVLGRDQDQFPTGNGKRARIAGDEQVSSEVISSTSGIFKGLAKETPVEKSPTKSSTTATRSANPLPLSNVAPIFAASAAKAPKYGTTTKPAEISSSAAPLSPFQSQPKAMDNNASNALSAPEASMIKVPIFGAPATNFLSQFGSAAQKSAAQSEKEAKKKRKAEEFDSGESDADEAEWERQDAEKERAKKQKMQEDLREASKSKPRFVPGKGLVTETAEPTDKPNDNAGEAHDQEPYVHELDKQHATAAKQQELDKAAAKKARGLFQSLEKAASGNEGSKNGDADDEDDNEGLSDDDRDQQSTTMSKGSGGDFASRVSFGKPQAGLGPVGSNFGSLRSGVDALGQLSGPAASVGSKSIDKSSPVKKFDFGKLSSSTPSQNVWGTVNSPNAFGSSEKGDNTWKPESPLKFGGQSGGSGPPDLPQDTPAVNITSPSPSKTSLESLFGTSKGTNATTATPAKPTALNFAADTPAGSIGSSFSFGISPLKPATTTTSSLFPPSTYPSNGVSRSTSPGATTGESAAESTADGEDDGAEKHDQLNLTSGGPGEEDEDTLHEVRAKASLWNEEKQEWETKGLGPFRVMKNRETGKVRMLMRQDPSGRVIINASIFKHFEYKAVNKSTFRVPIPSASGKLETWIVKVGKDADSGDITKILEENKNQS